MKNLLFNIGLIAPSLITCTSVSPVQKVVQLLEDVKAKGQGELEGEAHIFSEYSEWVNDQIRDKGFEIKDMMADLEELSATSEKADADAGVLKQELSQLQQDISVWEGDLKAATELRKTERDSFVETEADLSESVDALQRAIRTLQAQNYDREQSTELLQNMSKNDKSMAKVLALLQSQPFGQPKVDAYEFQSQSIIDMLKDLLKKFKKELNQTQVEESNRRHAFDLMSLNLNDSLEIGKRDHDEKSSRRASLLKLSAETKGQHSSVASELIATRKYLKDVQATYETKSNNFHANQKLRKEEIEAINKAIEILSSDKVQNVDVGRATSFLQVGRTALRADSALTHAKKAIEFLQNKAKKLNSTILAQLATHVSEAPFAKVVNMIRELISRLEEEAAAEADHKQWCDAELKENKLNREKKQSEVDTLTATAAELDAKILKLSDSIKTLRAREAELVKAMATATEQRTKEKMENEKTIADAKAAQEAVMQAVVVLKDFYGTQPKEESYIQQVPEMELYKPKANSGVVGMLEVIQSDFARLEAETTADESQASSSHATFMKDAKSDKEATHKAAFEASLKKDRREHDLHLTNKDLKSSQEGLDAALDYFDSLKAECLTVKVSYEERVKQREEEIASLQEAYEILGGNISDVRA